MKLTLTLFLFCLVSVTASNIYSQSTRLTISLKNGNIVDLFRQIEEKSEFYFFYQKEDLKDLKQITVEAKNAKVMEVLDMAIQGAPIDYKIVDRYIVVRQQGDSFGENFLAAAKNMSGAQQRTVTGKVTDESGMALPGVTIVVKGTTQGTVTSADGEFSLTNVQADATLVFSFVGMKTQEIEVAGKTRVEVVMEEETIGLDEVVAIGYGTQKKANLTGSVASVNAAELTKRVTPNVQNLLQGKVSGLQITQESGQPGEDDAQMRIRGVGTFSSTGSSPLVLIDGIQGNMADLDPNDVESVSVLKDAASAAIYGARAANGVILVSTKGGTAKPVSVDYHATLEVQDPTRLPDLLTNSADYMELWNYANERAGLAQYFSQATIDAFRNAEGTNNPRYPNFDWIDHSYKTAVTHNHHLSVSGGNEKTKFNVAVGFRHQPGIVKLYEAQKYNVHMAIDTKVNDWFTLGGNFQASKKDRIMDIQAYYSIAYYIMHTFAPGPNYTPTMTLPDGSTGYVARYSNTIAEWTVRNPDAMIAQGQNENTEHSVRPLIYASINITPDLKWYTKGAVNFDYSFNKNHENPVDCYYFDTGEWAHNGAVWHLGVRDDMRSSLMTTFYSTLNYQKTFNSVHDVNVLAGYNQEDYFWRRLYGSRVYFPTTTLKELNAGSSTNQGLAGEASEWAIQSFFGRLNYGYKGKYLLEGNFRYDGTSRIAPDTRWGFFPSVSGGWRISEEMFMEDVTWLDNLKLRASWGQLGNQNVGTYPYQDVLSTTDYVFTGLETGAVLTRLVDKTLKWETTTITDIGLDFSYNNGLITLTADWYNKFTDDILYSIPIPTSVGLSAPTVNGGQMKNVGWDFELGHNNVVGEVSYSVNLNISTYKNEVVKIIRPSYGRTTVQEGLPYDSWYLTEWIGIFQDQAEIDAAPVHQYNPKPGDLIFKDQNGDNKINADDRIVVDGAFPDFHYGANANLRWKNFDINLFLQGVEGLKNYVTNWGLSPYIQGAPPTMNLVKNRWTGPGSTNKYPAMYRAGYGPVMSTNSTFHLYDASYLRVKNLRIGYTLPSDLTQRIGIRNFEVYFSGDNLLTFTQYPGSDPERTTSGSFSVYPQLRTLALGFKVKL